MLIIEIAAGVFIGGIGLWALTRFLKRKKQDMIVEKKIAELFEAADKWISQRFTTLTPNYLDVFRERLTTIYDDPEHTPLICAQAEFEIFTKNSNELESLISAEILDALKESFEAADKFGVREKLDESVRQHIAASVLRLKNDAMLLYTNTLLGKKNGTANP